MKMYLAHRTTALLLAAAFAAGGAAHAAERAGIVILAVGQVTARAADGSRRHLRDGGSIYSGDSLSTASGAWLDMDFEDGGRILLRPGSQFQIEQFDYRPAAHPDNTAPTAAAEHESAFFRLLKGGLRAVSGLIGHVYRASYRMDTPVATIGIRGTEYDVRYCAHDCSDEASKSEAPRNGLYTGVDKGAISVSNQTAETITTADEYLYVHDERSPITPLKAQPIALRHMALPEKYLKQDAENRQRFENRRLRDQRLRERRRLREQLRHHRQHGHGSS